MPELSSTNARLAAARRLTRRAGRREAGRFLAEGAPAVREAIAAGAVVEMFATASALQRYPELTATAAEISDRDAAALSETVTPQGLVAVCATPAHSVQDVLAASPRLVAAMVEPNEPGNLGAVVRSADAAGADAVLVVGGTDPFGGKAVRASAGSVFHLPIGIIEPGAVAEVFGAARDAAILMLATTAHGDYDLFGPTTDALLAQPTMWWFGTEAHGLPDDVLRRVDAAVAIPIRGRAESLNLAAAAAVCLYASARAQSHLTPSGE